MWSFFLESLFGRFYSDSEDSYKILKINIPVDENNVYHVYHTYTWQCPRSSLRVVHSVDFAQNSHEGG